MLLILILSSLRKCLERIINSILSISITSYLFLLLSRNLVKISKDHSPRRSTKISSFSSKTTSIISLMDSLNSKSKLMSFFLILLLHPNLKNKKVLFLNFLLTWMPNTFLLLITTIDLKTQRKKIDRVSINNFYLNFMKLKEKD